MKTETAINYAKLLNSIENEAGAANIKLMLADRLNRVGHEPVETQAKLALASYQSRNLKVYIEQMIAEFTDIKNSIKTI